MRKYEVTSIVCDYGILEDGRLIPELILNSRKNAELIKAILEADEKHETYKLVTQVN